MTQQQPQQPQQRRGWGTDMKESQRGGAGSRVFWLPPGKETTFVILDDLPVEMYRHQLFIKGDKVAGGMRCTCSDPYSQDDVPRSCLVCNGMVRHKQIGRKPFLYLSGIDERQYEYNGKTYKDMKQLLELDKRGAEIFQRRAEAHGGKLAGLRFRVYRSTAQNSPRYGDSWEKLDQLDLVQHFWYSPAVPFIIESASRGGQRPLSHEQAVGQLITPLDYAVACPPYTSVGAERFVAYLEGAVGVGGGAKSGGGGGGYQAPPPPGGAARAPQAPPAPNYGPPQGGIPASQVPPHAPAPQYAPPAPPQQQYAAPAGPPRVPDPRGATAPVGQSAYQAPPHGGPQPQYAPAGPPAAPPPAPAGRPVYTAPAPTSWGSPPQQAPAAYGASAGYAPQQHAAPAYAPPPPPGMGQGPPQAQYAPPPPPAPGTTLPPQANAYPFDVAPEEDPQLPF